MRYTESLFFTLGLFAVLLATACNDIPDCDEPFTTELIVEFRDSLNAQSSLEFFDVVREMTTGFNFVENDTLRQLNLEVNPRDTTTGYVFEGDGLSDTLVVSYRLNQLLVSEFCGPALRVIDLQIIKHTFADTVVVRKELLRNEVNIQIIR